MTRVHRTDFAGSTRAVTRTPQGGLRLDAVISRVGVLEYQDHDGKVWRELKPADELFRADSMQTLEGAPVTELHPDKMVDGDTWASVSVGHLVGAPRRDGDYVVAPIAVQRADTAKRVESRELHDVSAGYTCRVDWTAGVFEGQAYDAVQRDIVYNHAALGPEGWGRAGTDVSLRMNGAAVQVRSDAPGKGNRNMKRLKVRKREYKLDADDEVQAAQDAVDEQAQVVDSMAAKLQAAEDALKGAIGEIAALKAKIEAEEKSEPKPVTEDMVPDEVADSIASKRVTLRDDARAVLGAEVKLDGLSTRKIHEAVVAKTLPEVKLDGLSNDAVHGMFTAAVAGAKKAQRVDALGAIGGKVPANGGTEHTDGDDEYGHLTPAAALSARTHNGFERRNSAARKDH